MSLYDEVMLFSTFHANALTLLWLQSKCKELTNAGIWLVGDLQILCI